MMASPACGSPQFGTGALKKSGYCRWLSWRKPTRRGQSGQSLGGFGSSKTGRGIGDVRSALMVHGGRGAVNCGSRALDVAVDGRGAADRLGELGDIEEEIGLAAQVVGDHRGLGGEGRDHGDALALALERRDERGE